MIWCKLKKSRLTTIWKQYFATAAHKKGANFVQQQKQKKGGVISDLSLRMTLLSPDWKCREQKQQKIDINLAEYCSRERNLSFLSAGLYPLFTLFHINQRTRTDRGSNTFVPKLIVVAKEKLGIATRCGFFPKS